MRSASLALTKSPVKSISVAFENPTTRGNRYDAAISVPARPTLTNRNAIFASSPAMRMSEASAIQAPAPAVVPFKLAMTGFASRRMFRMSSQVMRVNSSSPSMLRLKSSPMMSCTSPPEQNARPVPVITTTRTEFSSRNAANVSVNSR